MSTNESERYESGASWRYRGACVSRRHLERHGAARALNYRSLSASERAHQMRSSARCRHVLGADGRTLLSLRYIKRRQRLPIAAFHCRAGRR